MNRADVYNIVSGRTDVSRKTVAYIMDAAFELILESVVQGKSVNISGFGVFRLRDKSAYLGANPYTGERIPIPAKRLPFFSACKRFKTLCEERWTSRL